MISVTLIQIGRSIRGEGDRTVKDEIEQCFDVALETRKRGLFRDHLLPNGCAVSIVARQYEQV
jgi:hypothetical protein